MGLHTGPLIQAFCTKSHCPAEQLATPPAVMAAKAITAWCAANLLGVPVQGDSQSSPFIDSRSEKHRPVPRLSALHILYSPGQIYGQIPVSGQSGLRW